MKRRRRSLFLGLIGAGVLAVVGAFGLSADRSRGRPAATTAADAAGLDVELSGCAAVVAGPVCELPADGTLRVWVRAAPADVTFDPATSKVLREVEQGAVHRVVVLQTAKELRVVSRAHGLIRSFRVAPRTLPPWLERARALRQEGNIEGATALARSAGASESDVDQAFGSGLRARIELAAGRPEASFAVFRDAVRLHRAAGRLSDAADDSFALAFALNQRSHRYEEARAVLDEVSGDVASYPDGRAREAYYRGTLATETGDARSAFRLLREAREHALRLGLSQLERNATNAHALQLELVGRTSEALELLRKLEADAAAEGAPACEKVEIAINIAYGGLLTNEQAIEETKRIDVVAPLERALGLCEAACKDAYLRISVLGNLAFASLQRGEPAAARAFLARAQAGARDARAVETLFWRDIEGQIALAEGDPARALAAFEEEARLAHAVVSFEASFRAAVGKASSLERLARNEDALAQYRAAEGILEDVSFLVPLGEGRGTFLGDRSKSARWGLDLLVRLGRAKEALSMARSSRARMVATLARTARVESFGTEARARWERALGNYRNARATLDAEAKDDWKLSRAEASRAESGRKGREAELRAALDDALVLAGGASKHPPLSALPEDATTLVFHPMREGWVEIVSDASGVTALAVHDLDVASLLAPVRARLQNARLLRILPYGVLRAVDFHAALSETAIEYPLDVPARSVSGGGGKGALVVFDPTLDLQSSHAEASHVVRVLREHGWTVDALGQQQATSQAVLPLLERARLLHYAGHGVFAGREAWESELPLSAGGHLAIGDVLALTAAPSRVVLSGCETARAAADSPAESLGLAQAFIVSGSDFVIAPVRPVDDAVAARMSIALYGALASEGPVDAAAVLRDAQVRLRSEDGTKDWTAFRVISR